MRKFIVEVYSDNDISEHEIFVELLSRFGNMIASVKEEAAQQSMEPTEDNVMPPGGYSLSELAERAKYG